MSPRILVLAAALSATTAPALAQAPGAAGETPKTMTKADFTSAVQARFAAIDTNKDGFLSKDELGAVQAKVLQQAQAAREERITSEFQKLDTNKDGSLSPAEFRAAAPPIRAGETPDQIVASLDSNKDGKVSADEYRAPPLANFERADANHDGTLTVQEVAAARSR